MKFMITSLTGMRACASKSRTRLGKIHLDYGLSRQESKRDSLILNNGQAVAMPPLVTAG